MDPPRCHRLCDLFGTCSAFCVCLLLLLLFLHLLLLLLQRLFSGPLCGGAVPYGSEKSSRLLPEGCASSCDDDEDFIGFFSLSVLRFKTLLVSSRPFSDACRDYGLGLSPCARRRRGFPACRRRGLCFFEGIAPRKGFGLLVLLGCARCRACTCSLSTL